MAKREYRSAAPYVPLDSDLPVMKEAVQECRGCDLYLDATQAVFGEGPATARIVLIGEEPGDEEDRQGLPFVGPAGRILDKALREAKIERSLVYVTNAVKHFRFEERGKRRIHKKPRQFEINACQPWLEAEMKRIRPRVLICLGATAAQAVFGKAYRLTEQRGEWRQHAWAPYATATIHPSALLRMPDAQQRRTAFAQFVEELRAAGERARQRP